MLTRVCVYVCELLYGPDSHAASPHEGELVVRASPRAGEEVRRRERLPLQNPKPPLLWESHQQDGRGHSGWGAGVGFTSSTKPPRPLLLPPVLPPCLSLTHAASVPVPTHTALSGTGASGGERHTWVCQSHPGKQTDSPFAFLFSVSNRLLFSIARLQVDDPILCLLESNRVLRMLPLFSPTFCL